MNNIWAGLAQSVQRLATGWTFRGSNPGGARFSASVQTGPPSLLYNGYRGLSGGEGGGVDHPPPSSAIYFLVVVVEQYLYYPFGSSWPVSSVTFTICTNKMKLM
jgi:hypothetical protein